jgi:hypothetical protein
MTPDARAQANAAAEGVELVGDDISVDVVIRQAQ